MSDLLKRPEVCSFCSLLCEVSVDLACAKRSANLSSLPGTLGAHPQDDGLEEESLVKSIDLISRASRVLVTGRIHSVESARSAIEFAQHVGGVVDPWDSDGAMDAIASMQRVGGYGVSLGEARDRSDLWIVVGDDRLLDGTPRLPMAMHRGHSVPMLLMGNWSDSSIQAWREVGFDAWCIPVDYQQLPRYLSQVTRLGLDDCDNQIGKWILGAQYTTVLYSPNVLNVECRDLWIDLMNRWVLRRNQTDRIATLSWSMLGATFHQTCTWLTGFPSRIRFDRQSAAVYEPNENRAKDWCVRRQSSAQAIRESVVVWVDDSMEELPQDFIELDLPKVIVGPNQCARELPAQAWLPSGIAGLTDPVNMFRGDQTLLVKLGSQGPRIARQLPSPTQWIRRLMECQ